MTAPWDFSFRQYLRTVKVLLSLLFAFNAGAVRSQDSNLRYPVEEIEQALRMGSFEIEKMATLKRIGPNVEGASVYDAKKATLKLTQGRSLQVKWKTAPAGGESFNNQPRYEIAAYEFQKLFLQPDDYVVPPTVLAALSLRQYQALDPKIVPTFDGTNSVLYMLQYWLDNVSPDKIFDKQRLKADSLYARHLANMNIFSYLIKHTDSNTGNFLISTIPENPRVFAVDNGVAFGSDASARGTEWRNLRVARLPRTTVDRLREITLEDLESKLGVVAQFTVVDGGLLVAIDPTPNMDKSSGVRKKGNLIQFGLTEQEINQVYQRLKKLLEDVDSGKLQTF